jgi:hypothetical protein
MIFKICTQNASFSIKNPILHQIIKNTYEKMFTNVGNFC